jgi:DNA ligase (NAD+)
MSNVIEFLNRAARQYYTGNPIISDEQFDSLADAVGYNQVGAKQHVNVKKHYHRMYSLQKFYEDETKVRPLAGVLNLCMSPKIDGAAVSHLFIEGHHVQSLTRGDGIEGRDVTEKFQASDLIPKFLNNAPQVFQVTGELAAPKTVENARNYAAGALNLGSVDEFRTRAVTFFAYACFPYTHGTFDADLRYLKSQGFNTVQDTGIHEEYPTDGVVFRINDNAVFEEQGYTSKHPKGAYALKERQECVETELLGVEWQVSRLGKVTPVALLKPVHIGDALVSRATLNNIGFIESLDLSIGDIVGVIKGGEVIPCITHKVDA